MQLLVKRESSSFSKDLSHEAKAKDSTRKARAKAKDSTLKAKTKDFKIVLEDPRGQGLQHWFYHTHLRFHKVP